MPRQATAPKIDVPAIRRGRVGDIPALWVPQPGPVVAFLRFRVGTADEKLLSHGVTHLIEHLTLSTLERGGHIDFNGWVGLNTTTFVGSGERADVRSFVAQVCEALHNLPLDRVAEEIKILKTEGAQRPAGVLDKALTRRFGSVGYGISWFDELGFDRLTPDAVADYAATHFTAGNAVFVATGSPRGFRADLPDGERLPLPDAQPVVSAPGWMWSGDDATVGVAWLSERSSAAGAFARAFTQRLEERLRHERSLVYSVNSGAERTGDWTHSIVASQVLGESAQDAVDALRAVMSELPGRPVSKAELREQRKQMQRALAAGGAHPGGWLDRAADEELFNRRLTQPTELIAEMQSVALDDVARCAHGALESAILLLPTGTTADGVAEATAPGGAPITTVRFETKTKSAKNRQYVAVGPEGATWRDGEQSATYRWSEVTAWARHSDGNRMYIVRDGRTLTIDPKIWASSERLIGKLDEHAPHDRRLDFGPLESPAPDGSANMQSAGLGVGVVILALLALLFFATTLSFVGDTVKAPTADNYWNTALSAAITAALAFLPLKLALATWRNR